MERERAFRDRRTIRGECRKAERCAVLNIPANSFRADLACNSINVDFNNKVEC